MQSAIRTDAIRMSNAPGQASKVNATTRRPGVISMLGSFQHQTNRGGARLAPRACRSGSAHCETGWNDARSVGPIECGALISQREFCPCTIARRPPDPSEILALAFKGEFRRFKFCVVSATIGINRTIFPGIATIYIGSRVQCVENTVSVDCMPCTAPCKAFRHCALDSTFGDRRQEESDNSDRDVDVRQPADRRCVGLLCRRGGRRLRACWVADGGRRGGGGIGYGRAGRRAACGRRGRAGQPGRPFV